MTRTRLPRRPFGPPRPANAGSRTYTGTMSPSRQGGIAATLRLRYDNDAADALRLRYPYRRCAAPPPNAGESSLLTLRADRHLVEAAVGVTALRLRYPRDVQQVDGGARRDECGIVPQVATGKNPGMKPAGQYRAVPLHRPAEHPADSVVVAHQPRHCRSTAEIPRWRDEEARRADVAISFLSLSG
jgi:hypothetical protein